ncbi:MAG: hypothetical protein GXP26_07125 [Planctomycetes bacterium]|nr:hypothetical protein [Planctomycetota bacterium]
MNPVSWDTKDTASYAVGYEDYVAIYADGRESGYEILIPYKLSAGMASDKAQYNLEISISDEFVTAHGEDIKNLTGKYETRWPRFPKVVPGREAELIKKRKLSE